MSIQLEFMESLGIARAFGIAQIFPAAIERRFGQAITTQTARLIGSSAACSSLAVPQDKELMQALGMFMGACNNVFQLVAQQYAVTPPNDSKARRFARAEELQVMLALERIQISI